MTKTPTKNETDTDTAQAGDVQAAAPEVAATDAAKPPLPMAHAYLTTRPSKEFGAQGVFVDMSQADAKAHGDLLAEATEDQIARRRGGAVSTVVE